MNTNQKTQYAAARTQTETLPDLNHPAWTKATRLLAILMRAVISFTHIYDTALAAKLLRTLTAHIKQSERELRRLFAIELRAILLSGGPFRPPSAHPGESRDPDTSTDRLGLENPRAFRLFQIHQDPQDELDHNLDHEKPHPEEGQRPVSKDEAGSPTLQQSRTTLMERLDAMTTAIDTRWAILARLSRHTDMARAIRKPPQYKPVSLPEKIRRAHLRQQRLDATLRRKAYANYRPPIRPG